MMHPRPDLIACHRGPLASLLLLALLATAAAAREPLPDEIRHGALLLATADAGPPVEAPLVDTAVSMTVTGLIARVRVAQTFTHTGSTWVNGVYVFPLPERAAVDHLRMTVGERRIEGRIEARATARRTYEQARDSGRKASLVEQQRPNLFTTRVANIGPGEQVVVTIEYQQTVQVDGDGFALRFPLASGIRYIPGTRPVGGFDGGGCGHPTGLSIRISRAQSVSVMRASQRPSGMRWVLSSRPLSSSSMASETVSSLPRGRRSSAVPER